MKNISLHITYNEAVKSPTAIRLGIENIPGENQIKNMRMLADKVFEPLRAGLGDYPLHISSFFRSEKINKALGGSKTSQHTAVNGAAMDIDSSDKNADIFYYIKDHLEFDQLIWEFGNSSNPSWVHVSYNEGKNRRQVLYSKIEDKKTVYKTTLV